MQNKNKLKLLDFFSFLLGFEAITVAYIMSAFLKSVSGMERMEFFYLLGFGISLPILIKLYKVIKKLGKLSTFKFLLVLKLCAFFIIIIFNDSYLAIAGAVISLALGPLIWAALDSLVENYTLNRQSGAVRGKFLTLMNLGMFLAPFLSAYLVGETDTFIFSFGVAFATVFLILMLVLFIFPREIKIKPDRRKLSVKKTFKKIFTSKKLSKIYYVAFILDFFYAAMIVYMPLYLLSLGIGWVEIGKIFTFMLLPFVLIQYPLGRMADKLTGEKEWLIVGILFMGIFSFIAGVVSHDQIFFWGAVLFCTRIGAAIIEVMRDSYFYKQIAPKDFDVIDFFRTSRSGGYIMVMVIFAPLLMILPLNNVFILLGLIVLSGIYPVMKLKDTR